MGEWTRIDMQPQTPERASEDSTSESGVDIARKKERPTVVTAVAAYEWLKAVLFVQLFWSFWSPSHASLATTVSKSGAVGSHYAVFLLLAVALYLLVLGWGLWNLQKWALLMLLLTLFPDFGYDLRPEIFGLEHTADMWLGDQVILLFIGITVADIVAFTFFVKRETYRAFNAEEEAGILEWLRWWI